MGVGCSTSSPFPVVAPLVLLGTQRCTPCKLGAYYRGSSKAAQPPSLQRVTRGDTWVGYPEWPDI
jgi:hypothetical protein